MDRYRLAPVRSDRERTVRVQRGNLAAAAADAKITEATVARAAERVTAAERALAAARSSRDAVIARGATPAQLVLAERFVARRRGELDAAIGERLRAEAAHAGRLDAIDSARATLARARADREVVERHFAAWRTAQKQLADRRED